MSRSAAIGYLTPLHAKKSKTQDFTLDVHWKDTKSIGRRQEVPLKRTSPEAAGSPRMRFARDLSGPLPLQQRTCHIFAWCGCCLVAEWATSAASVFEQAQVQPRRHWPQTGYTPGAWCGRGLAAEAAMSAGTTSQHARDLVGPRRHRRRMGCTELAAVVRCERLLSLSPCVGPCANPCHGGGSSGNSAPSRSPSLSTESHMACRPPRRATLSLSTSWWETQEGRSGR